jgi:hypothetical protein
VANDSPDWVTQAAPALVGTVVIQAGSAQGILAAPNATPARLAVLVVPDPTGGVSGQNVTEVVATGAAGNPLVDVTFPNLPDMASPVLVPTLGTIDGGPSITVKLGGNAVATGPVATVWELDAPLAGWVWAPSTQPVPVTVGNFPVTQTVAVMPAGALAMKSAVIGQTLANNATSTIVTGVAGQTITIYGYQLVVGPGGGPAAASFWQAEIRDTTATVFVCNVEARLLSLAGLVNVPAAMSLPQGLKLPVGAGIQTAGFTGSATPVELSGVVYYTQG